MREIVFDTETNGLNPASGDRVVEIGCIEMVNRVPTGRTFHAYFNPGRTMPAGAQAIHGLTDAFPGDGCAKNVFGVGGLRASRGMALVQAMSHLLAALSAFTGGAGTTTRRGAG